MAVPHPSPPEQVGKHPGPWPAAPPSASTPASDTLPGVTPGPVPTATEPLVCRRCAAITIPQITPGTGPHAFEANCPDCGGFMRWMSQYTPTERAARREQARREAMTHLTPTGPQLAYLRALGDSGPPPANRAEASARIDQLKHDKGVA
jgi:hypothetical protein